MTGVKLVNGTVINASDVSLVNGILMICTTEKTVEDLHALFTNKSNTSRVVLLAENGDEVGYKEGFTSFAGIYYSEDGTKTVELFQPKDVTEERISKAESAAVKASDDAKDAQKSVSQAEEIITDVELAIVELYEMLLGGE